jgi:hypothetical protein
MLPYGLLPLLPLLPRHALTNTTAATGFPEFDQSVELFQRAGNLLSSAGVQLFDADDRGFNILGSTIYNNIISSSNVLKTIIVNLCQLFFNSVGWYLTSYAWSIVRCSAALGPRCPGEVRSAGTQTSLAPSPPASLTRSSP